MNHCEHCDHAIPAGRRYCGRSCLLLAREEDRKFSRPVSRDTGTRHRLDQYYGEAFRLPYWLKIAACLCLLALCGCQKRTALCSTPNRKVPTTQQEAQTFVQRWNEYAQALTEGHISLEMWQRVTKAWERMTTE
jgi:hypothetical protein